MSITFPSEQLKPSSLEGLPNQFTRPSFEELYGFDAITDALLTEANQVILTEDREIIQFDEGSPVPPTANIYTNSDSTLSVEITGSIAVFTYDAVPNADRYDLFLIRLSPVLKRLIFQTPTPTRTFDLSSQFSSGDILRASYRARDTTTQLYGPFSLPIVNFTF
jgi:hypothetical protein